jgi:outer membrane protein assembly factor BamB
VQALDAGTGKILWQHDRLNGTVGQAANAPVVVNGVIYVSGEAIQPGGQTGVYALRASDGKLLWSYPGQEINFMPVQFANGVLIAPVASQDKHGLLALRASDGALLWQQSWDITQQFPTQPPVIAGDNVYLAMQQGPNDLVSAWRVSDGQALWTYQVKGEGPPLRIFGITNAAVYVAKVPGGPGPENAIDALKVSDGSLLWETQAQSLVYPTLADGAIYVHEMPAIAAFDASTGKPLWQATTRETPASGSISEIAEAGGTVYLASNGIAAFSASDGRPLWTHPTNCQFPTQHPLLAIGSTVYYTYHYVQAVGKEAFHVYALRAADGKALW